MRGIECAAREFGATSFFAGLGPGAESPITTKYRLLLESERLCLTVSPVPFLSPSTKAFEVPHNIILNSSPLIFWEADDKRVEAAKMFA